MRSRVLTLGMLTLVAACGSTCQKPSETGDTAASGASAKPSAVATLTLPGVDTKRLTPREKKTWSGYVREMLAPCPQVAAPLSECVQNKRNCTQCVPAAQFLSELVQAGRPKNEVLKVYNARFHPKRVKTVVIGGSPIKGPSNAEVTLIEFADFECPACANAYPLVEQMYQKYKANMRVVFKHFPLDVHPHARLAAQASFAAQKQGQFWGMHALLFKNRDHLTEPDLLRYAKALSLDVTRFQRDMVSEAAKQRVEQEKDQGIGLGVEATPTIIINGRDCDLSLLPDVVGDMEDWIELEIKLAKERAAASAAPSSTASAAPSSTASAAPSSTASAAPSAAP